MVYFAIRAAVVIIGDILAPHRAIHRIPAGWIARIGSALIMTIFLAERWAARRARNDGERRRMANP
jgi:hypothetical protein